VGPFHDPAARLRVGVSIFQQPLFGARFYARVVAMLASDFASWIADIAGIEAEILLVAPRRNFRTLDHDLSQSSIQKLRVVHVGAADGDRQREPTAVDQQAAFAPIFSPGRSGSDQHIR